MNPTREIEGQTKSSRRHWATSPTHSSWAGSRRVGWLALLLLAVPSLSSAREQAPTTGTPAPASLATFSLEVRSVARKQLEKVYFALVPRDVAWRRPTAEIVGDARKVALTLEVPAGVYRWVVSAPGSALHFGDEVTLAAGAKHRESVDLTPLVTIEGEVRDRKGKPVEGAVVAHLRALSDALPGSLSQRARPLLQENFRTVSTKKGAFRLPAASGWRHFVWIEAPGFAPATLRDILVEGKGLEVPPVQLEPGGRLRVVWQRKAKEDGVRLELRPVDTSWFDERGLKRGWFLWEREARGKQQAWPSLRAGTYELWAKGPADGDHEILPQQLAGEIKLTKGATTEIEVNLPTLEVLAASSAPSALVQVVSGADGLPLTGVELVAVAEADVDAFMKALHRDGKRPQVATRKTDEHGWARFPRMPAGTAHFVVGVVATGEDQPWPFLSQAFEFVAGHELLVEIELPQNGSIEIEPILSSDLQEESVGVQISLADASGEHGQRWRSRTAKLDGAATVLFEDIPPGPWRALAIIELEGGMKHVTGQTEIELAPGATERVELEIEAALFRGRVTYLGEPVVGAISLRPVEPEVGRSVPRTYSGEDGRFVVPIETPGWYDTSVAVDSLMVLAELGPVLFDDPESEIELELPAGRIVGKVVDGDGTPVPAAQVQGKAFGEDRPAHGSSDRKPGTTIQRLGTKSDSDGRFVFEMVDAGTWSLQAEKAGDKSATETLTLSGTPEERTVELVIDEQRTIAGRVVDTSGLPRAGVRVGISPMTTGVAMPVRYGATTDADGSFEIRANDLVGQRANVTVIDTASAAGSARFQTINDPIEVTIPSQGGSVILHRAQAWPRVMRPPSPFALIGADGGYLFLAAQSSFISTAAGVPNRWDLPDLAPGSWAVVHLISTADYQTLAAGAGAGLLPLARFDVVAGGEVEVEVP